MAIEFNCPYCTATIRVPDAFSGKKGSCPKCATKLMVPDIVPKYSGQSSPSPSPDKNADVLPTETIQPTSHPTEVAAPAFIGIEQPVAADIPIPAFGDTPPPADLPTFAPPAPTTTLSRNLRKKAHRKKSQRLYTVGIPVVCFFLFFGVVAVIMMTQAPELKGTLRGTIAAKMEIPVVKVPVSDFGLTSDEEAAAFQAFADSPEAFVSSQMTCRISLEGSFLAINVKEGSTGFIWFAVNPTLDVTLAEWIRDHRIEINKQRLRRIASTGHALCKDKIQKEGGTSVVFDAETYRDGFGLAAHVGAFGYVVEAVTQNHRSVCAHEDSNGILYFVLPEDTTSFTLRGRTVETGQPLFPGEYSVVVEGAAATEEPNEAVKTSEETMPETESMTPETSEPTSDEAMGMKPMSGQ